jgi:predicted Zn-dependent protease with MMP-like domain
MDAKHSFETLVSEALDSLPEDIAAAMDNVEVVVEDEPPPELLQQMSRGSTLFGLYQGVPLTERTHYDRALPDKISIFRGPVERSARTPEDIKEQVRRTIVHEIAHHFGIDDARLDDLGWS